jgi:REP element-mobilizing transposase RayT
MANTYTQLYVQLIFAVQNRKAMINPNWETDLFKYINGIVSDNGHKLYLINGVEDHLHALVSMAPKQSVSDLMFNIKRSSSIWINQNKLTLDKFNWQDGYGAFSLGKAQLKSKIAYIENQKEHHKKKKFIAEYLKMLKENDIDFDERYIFKEI